MIHNANIIVTLETIESLYSLIPLKVIDIATFKIEHKKRKHTYFYNFELKLLPNEKQKFLEFLMNKKVFSSKKTIESIKKYQKET